jgi:hypothetical protein
MYSREDRLRMVGSKLVYPDGKLQEAGRNCLAGCKRLELRSARRSRQSVYNYLREADYCSGASLLIPAALFEKLAALMNSTRLHTAKTLTLRSRFAQPVSRFITSRNPSLFIMKVFPAAPTPHNRDQGLIRYSTRRILRAMARHVLERDHYPNGTSS